MLGCARSEPEQPTPDTAGWELGPFTKHANNPIIMPRGDTWEAKDVLIQRPGPMAKRFI